MTIRTKLQGDSMQVAVVQLEPGQLLYAEAGKFLWKTTNITTETRATKPSDGAEAPPPPPGAPGAAPGGGSGFFNKALKTGMEMGKRALAGESMVFDYFSAQGAPGLVSFAGVMPGHMQLLELDGSRGWMAGKDSFVFAESTVHFDIAFNGFKAGRKGGEGFVLEKFTGVGTVLIAGAGNFISLDLAKYGGKVQVQTGCVVAFQEGITYGVERVGGLNASTALSMAFGSGGINLTTLEGDGQVILQSMTYEGIGKALTPFIQHRGDGSDKGMGGIGSLLGGGGA
ncbi:MAG TPA: AIM24 family protein [Acidimicrobiales bacterium]|jgi:uncharacterized protein (AIM24 family)